MKIILASQSPRRKQLLEMAEIDFTVKTVPTQELFPETLSPELAPLYIAKEKVQAICATLSDEELYESIIIAADTVVILENRIIGKPKNEKDAIDILEQLSGKTHKVVTGVVINYKDKSIELSEETLVYFNDLDKNQIEHYVKKYEPMDKAGAYAIQEWIGAIGISKIDGDFYNVMGLPINKVSQEIQKIISSN